jgi:hypothetical protein
MDANKAGLRFCISQIQKAPVPTAIGRKSAIATYPRTSELEAVTTVYVLPAKTEKELYIADVTERSTTFRRGFAFGF